MFNDNTIAQQQYQISLKIMVIELLQNSISIFQKKKKKRHIRIIIALYISEFRFRQTVTCNLKCNSGEKWRFLFRNAAANSTESYDVHQIFGFHLSRV